MEMRMGMSLAQERRARVLDVCQAQGWQALLVWGNAWRCDYVRYVSDFATLEGHCFAWLDAEGALTLFVDSPGEAERAAVETVDCDIVCAPDIVEAVNRRVKAAGNTALAAAPRGLMPAGIEALADGRCQDAAAALALLFTLKTEREHEAVRRASDIADRGYEVFRQIARPGVTEFELVAEVEHFLRTQGCPDNFMIVGSGGREVRGMHPPGTRRLQQGDLVTTELSPCVDGYYAQICRTLVIGEPNSDQLGAFDVFRQALEAGIAAVRPGVTAAAVAKAENDVFRQHGLGDYTTSQYTRVRGHGLGLFLDSAPALLEDVDLRLAEGMTLIVHPNTYHPRSGYIVLGDALIVTDTGAEILTRTPRELFQVAG